MVPVIKLRRRLFLIPLITFIFIILSFIITYAIAVAHGHVEIVFPYISYTGIKLPERGVFGQLINVGAMLLALNVYLRFLRLEAYSRGNKNKKLSRLNAIGMVLGLLSAFGISMVANFETVVMRAPHYVGAALAFGVGIVYCWVQTYMSYQRRQRRFLRNVFICQAINSFVMSVFAVAFAASKAVYLLNKVDENSKYQKGFIRQAYLTSTVSEWLLAVSFMTFLLTYIPEYLTVQLKGPFLKESEDQQGLTVAQNHTYENGTEENELTYDESSAETPISV